jgi:hypothetical protein
MMLGKKERFTFVGPKAWRSQQASNACAFVSILPTCLITFFGNIVISIDKNKLIYDLLEW